MSLKNIVLIVGIVAVMASQFIMKDFVLIIGIILIMAYVLLVRKERKDTALMPIFYFMLLFLILYFIAISTGFRLFE